MAVAGVFWGLYSLQGRGSSNPLSHTTGNFVRALPLVAVASLPFMPRAHLEPKGVLLSVISGAVTSGLGYVIWYSALRGLTAMQAAIVQLAVPLLAAGGGVLLLSEAVSLRLALSTVMVLGGIAVAIVGRASSAT
jgi:drug/metabolite transporter (DMT)-like permease